MKTDEEKKATRDATAARILENVGPALPRTGYIPQAKQATHEPAPALKGLELSDVQLWPLDRFKDHPSNHVFDSSKTEAYWRDLRRDILEAGAIINPVIALPDGTLLEGHSRLRIARELVAEGKDLGRIPVRLVASPMTAEEAERRVYLGNLSRFELDEDTRLDLYVKVWPGWYRTATEEKEAQGGATVAPPPPTRAEIAERTGKSKRQIKYDAALTRQAEEIAQKKGKALPGPEEIKKAREKKNAERRAKMKAPAKASGRVRLDLSREDAEVVLRILRTSKANAAREAVHQLRKALRGEP